MNKTIYQIVSKISLLLIIAGFLQPIVLNQNGFTLAKWCLDLQAIDKHFFIPACYLYILFFSVTISIVGAVIGLYINKEDYSEKISIFDVILLLLSIICGTKFFMLISDIGKGITSLTDEIELNTNIFDLIDRGTYFIFAGWILAFIFLLLGKEENFYKKAARKAVMEATQGLPQFVPEDMKKTISIKEVFTGASACCYYCFFVIFLIGGFLIYL